MHFFPDPSQYFSNHGLISTYYVLRSIVTALDAFLVVFILWLFVKIWPFRPRIHPNHGMPKKTFTLRDAILKDRWEDVMKKVATGKEDAMKLAIIEADKIVDDALKQMGLPGEHMADRMQELPAEEVRTLPRLWRAHRLRNNLVHTPGFLVTAEETRKAIADYEAFLKEVGLFT